MGVDGEAHVHRLGPEPPHGAPDPLRIEQIDRPRQGDRTLVREQWDPETVKPIERLVESLKRLPGIGEKSANRLAFHLLGSPDAAVTELADAIARLKRETVLCERCFDLTDSSPCENETGTRAAPCAPSMSEARAARSETNSSTLPTMSWHPKGETPYSKLPTGAMWV